MMEENSDSIGGQQFRRRQIDVNKPLKIIWMKDDQVENQAEMIQQIMGSPKPPTKEAKLKNKQILQNQLSKEKKNLPELVEVPTPGTRTLTEEDTEESNEELSEDSSSFTRPVSYIHYTEKPYDFDSISYALDDNDDDFLSLWNSSVKTKYVLTDSLLEEIITLLENEMFQNRNFETKGVKKSKDKTFHLPRSKSNNKFNEVFDKIEQFEAHYNSTNDVCSICRSKDNLSILLQCLYCKEKVHSFCYYGELIEETESWICDWCKFKKSDEARNRPIGELANLKQCALCFRSDGLLRSVNDSEKGEYGSFAHTICSNWVSELYEDEKTKKLTGFENIEFHRWNSYCKYCRQRGVCIQCSYQHCRALYHPFCAQQGKLHVDLSTKTFYCFKHTNELLTTEMAVPPFISTQTLQRLLLIAPVIKQNVRKALGSKLEDVVFEVCFFHWAAKRRTRNCFLLDQLNKISEEEIEKPKKSKKKIGSEKESLDKIIKIRKDLEYVRILLDMIRKREILKRNWLVKSKQINEAENDDEDSSTSSSSDEEVITKLPVPDTTVKLKKRKERSVDKLPSPKKKRN